MIKKLVPIVLGLSLGYALMSGCFEFGRAHADGSALVADAGSAAVPPAHTCTLDGKAVDCSTISEHPAETVSAITKLWKGGALVPAIIVALFAVFSIASRRIAWLTKDHRAAYTASGLAFLTVLVEPASRGTTPTLAMVMTALTAAVALFINPKKPGENATAAPSA